MNSQKNAIKNRFMLSINRLMTLISRKKLKHAEQYQKTSSYVLPISQKGSRRLNRMQKQCASLPSQLIAGAQIAGPSHLAQVILHCFRRHHFEKGVLCCFCGFNKRPSDSRPPNNYNYYKRIKTPLKTSRNYNKSLEASRNC